MPAYQHRPDLIVRGDRQSHPPSPPSPPASAGILRKRILAFALECGRHGFIADELEAAWGCSHNHTSPRIAELLADGELIPTGERRRTRSGSTAHVFVAKQFAEQLSDPPAQDLRLFLDDAPPRHLDLG
jgi:hypothetical protein